MQVGFRTVHGVRGPLRREHRPFRAFDPTDEPLARERVCLRADLAVGRERRSPGGRGPSGPRSMRAPGRPPGASRDGRVPRPVCSRAGAIETACRRAGPGHFCRRRPGDRSPAPPIGGIMSSATTPVSTQREPALVGQTVVVIGGSAGIGLETARRARAEVPMSSSQAAIPTGSSKRRWNLARNAPRPSTPTTRLPWRGSSWTCQHRSTM
jgi:hypothetical protein